MQPEVELYDDQQYRVSHEASERRLAAARRRGRALRRWRALGVLAAVVGVPFVVTLGIVAARAPQSPFVVLTWPKPKSPQILASGQTVLARGGQPFEVAVTDAEKWNVTWKSGGAQQQDGVFNWAPADGVGQMTALCKPVTEGWISYFSWVWPTRQVTLRSVNATSQGNYARQLATDRQGVWVYPHVFAAGNVAWDERALPLLAQAADLLSNETSSGAAAPARALPSEGLWRLVSDFDGESAQPSKNGTFASLHAPNLEEALPTIAARIVKTAPAASVKFVLRLDRDPQQGILRVAYDGKRERKAWVRRAGDSNGKVFTGWEDGEWKDRQQDEK